MHECISRSPHPVNVHKHLKGLSATIQSQKSLHICAHSVIVARTLLYVRRYTVYMIGFNQSRAGSAHRMRETDDDNSRGDCVSRMQSPSRDQRCLRWSDVKHP